MKKSIKLKSGGVFSTTANFPHERIIENSYQLDTKLRVVTFETKLGEKITIPLESIDIISETV